MSDKGCDDLADAVKRMLSRVEWHKDEAFQDGGFYEIQKPDKDAVARAVSKVARQFWQRQADQYRLELPHKEPPQPSTRVARVANQWMVKLIKEC